MAVSSYGTATKTSGVVRIVKDLDLDLTGRHVLLVEDIVDSGLTLSYLRKNLQARSPASLEVCALLVRDGSEIDESDLRYVGFRIPRRLRRRLRPRRRRAVPQPPRSAGVHGRDGLSRHQYAGRRVAAGHGGRELTPVSSTPPDDAVARGLELVADGCRHPRRGRRPARG